MPRNSSGVYTLPVSAFQAGSVALAADINNDFNDIANALTQSLATTGVSSMTAPIRAFSGTLSAPGYTFNSDTDSGFYLIAANTIGIVTGGALVATLASDLSITWTGNQIFSGAIVYNSAVTFTSLNISGNFTVGGTANYTGGINVTGAMNISATVSFSKDANFGSIVIKSSQGFAEFTEVTAPTSAAANSIRLYVKDVGGYSRLAYNDENGVEQLPGWNLLLASSVTSSVATLDIVLTSYVGYQNFAITFSNATNDTNATRFFARLSSDGGTTFDSGASNYGWALVRVLAGSGTQVVSVNAAATEIQLTTNELIGTTVSLPGRNSLLYIFNCSNASALPKLQCDSVYTDSSTNTSTSLVTAGGTRLASQITNAIRFFYSSGNIRSCQYSVYGLVQ
jgi:hypothetical protein